jgi:hypothetical protein
MGPIAWELILSLSNSRGNIHITSCMFNILMKFLPMDNFVWFNYLSQEAFDVHSPFNRCQWSEKCHINFNWILWKLAMGWHVLMGGQLGEKRTHAKPPQQSWQIKQHCNILKFWIK